MLRDRLLVIPISSLHAFHTIEAAMDTWMAVHLICQTVGKSMGYTALLYSCDSNIGSVFISRLTAAHYEISNVLHHTLHQQQILQPHF
uniref:Uncharacterized protein n=1 Tax=Parascaris univalens TaxID=6257 RepID=A0A915C9E4_PARUN